MSLAILFHFLCTQHVSDIIRSLRLCCWITTLVVLFSVRCVFEIWCGWFWGFSLQHGHYSTQPHQISHTQWTENKTTDVVIQQHSRKLLMMDILMSETCRVHKKWNKIASDIKLVFYSSRVHRLYQGILHFQNVTRFHETCVKIISFTTIRKVKSSIFIQLRND